jgi:hypothetical protein
MIVVTEKAGEIRKYFLKLESITMSVIKNSIENNIQIKDKQTKLLAKSEQIMDNYNKDCHQIYRLYHCRIKI